MSSSLVVAEFARSSKTPSKSAPRRLDDYLESSSSHRRLSASPMISPRTDGRLVPQSLDVTDYLDPPHEGHRGESGRERPAVQYPLVARTEDDPRTYHQPGKDSED